MNTNNITTLSWNQLMSPKLIGEEIIICHTRTKTSKLINYIYDRCVSVVGTAYIGNEHVLLVYDKYLDDIFIILRDGQGLNWDAYKIL